MLTKDEIVQRYNLYGSSFSKVWKYGIVAQFKDRSFNLACRTKYDQNVWMNAFNKLLLLIDKGEKVEKINPYDYAT